MYLLSRRSILSAAGAATGAFAARAVFPGLSHAAADEAFSVFTADPMGGLVDSTLVIGESRALLIDGQFTLSNAERLRDVIKATGRALETIFVTHFHPDHHFGVAVLKNAWPEAKIVAHPAVASMLGQMGQSMFDQRKEQMGDALPDKWMAPEALSGSLNLEGEVFEVLDPMVGDTKEITPVLLPQFGAIVAADLVYNGTWAWLKETPDWAAADAWLASLDALEAMDADVIVPGHRTEDAANDASGIAHNRKLLHAWQQALDETKTESDLKEAMVAAMGELPGAFFLDMAVKAVRG
jgi:glyoxylase-like metal-dependent hydrolase (beta-lactamase superfamily II)